MIARLRVLRSRMKTLPRAVARMAIQRPALLEVAFVFLVVAVVWRPFLVSGHVDNQLSDWSYRSNYVAYTLNALLHDHAFPYWVTNPDFEQFRVKGVHDFFANPETDVLSVVTPAALFWGVLGAAKASLLAYLALGVWGCRRLIVALGGSAGALSLLVASLLSLCNGAIVAHALVGHTQFVPAAAFPLALAFMIEAMDPALPAARRCFRACLAGAVLAMAYYAGAAHPLYYFVAGFVVLTPIFTLLLAPRRFPFVVPATALVGISFLVLAAFKLLPGLVDFAGYHVDYRGTYDGWRDLAANIVMPWYPEGHGYHHETNLYVGWVGVGFLAFAVLGVRDRRCVALLLACAVLTFFMCWKGDGRPFTLPVARTQGALQRARLVVMPAVSVVAASQLQTVVAWIRKSPRRSVRLGTLAVVAGLSVFLAFDLSRTSVWRHEKLGRQDVLGPVKGPFDTVPEIVPVDARVPRVKVTGSRANVYGYEYWTELPERTLLQAPGIRTLPRLPHLRLVGDGELTTRDDVLAIRVVKPHGCFELRFSDPLMAWAGAVSLLGVVGVIALGLVARKAGRVREAPVA